MATGVVSWSQTAATNATADANVNWAEGMAASQVNDSARGEMASVAKYRDDNAGTLATGGSSSAYTVTSNQGFANASALVGARLSVKFILANASGATINVDGCGAIPLTYNGGGNLATGAIQSQSIWDITFPSTSSALVVASNSLGLMATDQTLTGGFITSSFAGGTFSSGSFTPDPGKGPLQAITNNGAFTLNAPTNQGELTLLVVNGASAGTITFSGYSVGSNKGDALDTVNGHGFFIKIYLINTTATYHIQAAQ